MQPGYELSIARGDDAPDLAAARVAMLDEMDPAARDANLALRVAMGAFFRAALAEGGVRMWLVRDAASADRLVVAVGGYCVMPHPPKAAEPAEARAFVINVWTHAAHRRKGLARAVMNAILADARARGIRRVDLRSSDAAREMYLSLGFKPLEMFRLDLG